MTEILGWIATAVVLLSFTIHDMRRLRLMNMLGCLLWIGYGLILIWVDINIKALTYIKKNHT